MQVDSTLLYAECDIREDEMPEAVATAIKQAVPGGKLDEIERQNEPEASVFTVEITAGGLQHYVQLDAKGAIRWHAVRLPAEVDLGLP